MNKVDKVYDIIYGFAFMHVSDLDSILEEIHELLVLLHE